MQAFDFKVFELTFRVRRLFTGRVRTAQEQRAVFGAAGSQVRRLHRAQRNADNPSWRVLHAGEEDAAPTYCNLSSPPPSPGINISGQPTWQPNGCGTGGIGSWFQDFILERVAGQSYSGNLDSPYVGVSFKGACDSHEQCWAMGGNRTTCDINFRNSMNSACSQLSDSGAQGNCSGFASLYHGAVSTTDGSHGAYATSTANRACAVWANDMRENGCAN